MLPAGYLLLFLFPKRRRQQLCNMIFKFFVHCAFSLLFGHCVIAGKLPGTDDFDPTYQTTPSPDADWARALVTPPWRPVVSGADVSVDLIFLIDGSGSVEATGLLNFKKLQKWLKSVASAFDFSNEKFRVGLVQYSHSYQHQSLSSQSMLNTELALGSCATTACFNSHVDGMQYMGYTTYTGAAINKTVKEDFAASEWDAAKILILITNGPSNDDVTQAADFARGMNVTLFGVGIGNYNISQLQWIANGEIGNNWRVFRVGTFDKLSKIVDALQREIKATYDVPACSPLLTPIHGDLTCTNANEVGSTCITSCRGKYTAQGSQRRTCLMESLALGPRWNGSSATCGVCAAQFDLLFILDSSSSIGQASFNVMKDFVMRLVDTFEIGRKQVQVSAIRYNSEVEKLWNYDRYSDKNSLMQAITSIGYSGSGTDTAKALYHALDNMFGPESGRREDKPHMTVVLTDGKSKRSTTTPAQRLHKISQVLAIGVNDAVQSEIDEIASDPDELYSHKVIDNFVDLLKIIRNISMKLCNAQTAVSNVVCPQSALVDPTGCLTVACSNGNRAGSVCRATCCQGYEPPGNGLASCYYNGKWSVSKWRCLEKRCKAIKLAEGMRVNCTNGNHIGSTCSVSCNSGYYLSGTLNNATCNASSSGQFRRCTHRCERNAQHLAEWDETPVTCSLADNCNATSCSNGGRCRNGVNSYSCECAAGFTGDRCQTEIDACASNPCENNARCENLAGSFKCHCPAGFGGHRCRVDIDDCAPDPCRNNATCVDLVNEYACNCPTGFSGQNCETAVDWCATQNCSRRGRCRNSATGYVCDCDAGFVGRDCEKDFDECEGQPCRNAGVCYETQEPGGFLCVCATGFAGATCEIDVPECSSNPCVNGGTCSEPEAGSYSCACAAGYEGTNCEAETDECATRPCLNGATCVDLLADYECRCADGYEGRRCEVDVDDCVSNRCANGTCVDQVNGYACNCTSGFVGEFCDMNFDDCASTPCENNATCSDEVNGYACICATGFTGDRCEDDVDECLLSPCVNGTCANHPGNFTCLCRHGYEGTLCDMPPDHCRNVTCQNNATCVNSLDGFRCDCPLGYNGTLCENDVNECVPNPCHNNGTCVDGLASFSCDCTYGFEGPQCENETVSCATQPCVNALSCMDDERGSFVCNCMDGYEGRRCELNKNECLEQPCKNGAECVDYDGGYRCICSTGYTGSLCEHKVDYCASLPCKNGGICESGSSNYTCRCRAGFHGGRCHETCSDCSCKPCANSGVCLEAGVGYVCRCTDQFRGPNCLQAVDPCSRDFCGGAGLCGPTSGDLVCLCDPGYKYDGRSCVPSADLLCNPSPCLNGAECSSQNKSYTCHCVSGYFGKTCRHHLDEGNCTVSDPCQNGGACSQTAGGAYLCACPLGFSGQFCERNESACTSSPCPANSYCEETGHGFRCVCHSGFTGTNCSEPVNECASNPCFNSGSCEDGVNMYRCRCHAGWVGERCEHDFDECKTRNWCNGGKCKNTFGSYECTCQDGFYGARCQWNVDECASQPCQHGGTCVDDANSYRCNCSDGYSGDHCEIDTDDCASAPCENNATCVDGTPGFTCNCAEGYGGETCATVLDHCRIGARPKCSNGGECIHHDNGYTCKCPPGFGGTACDQVHCVLPLDAAGRSGRILCQGDGRPGTVCQLLCDPGLVPLDRAHNNTRICANDSTWTGTDEERWSCVAPSCGRIAGAVSSGGTQAPQSTRSFALSGVLLKSALVDPSARCNNGSAVGSTCVFSCRDGYQLIGSVTSTCDHDGEWRPAPPAKCVPTHCPEPQVLVDHTISSFLVSTLFCTDQRYGRGSMCFLTCYNGFTKDETSPDAKMCDNGQWTPSAPFRCVPSACRGPPPTTHNGRYVCTNEHQLGSRCESRCEPGYVEAIRGLFACTTHFGLVYWQGHQGICTQKLCEHSLDLRTGIVREIQENSAVRIVRGSSGDEEVECGRQAKIIVDPTTLRAVHIDLWYGGQPSGHHLNIGYDSEASEGENGIFGINDTLAFRGNWVAYDFPGFFRYSDHVVIMITSTYVHLNSNGRNRTIDVSRHDPIPMAISVNQALAPNERTGSGLCVLCINT